MTMENSIQADSKPEPQELPWQEVVAKYRYPNLKSSIWQVVNSMVPYFVLCYLMYRSLEISYWLTLLLAIPTAGFLIRIFIIFHDCGHGSLFKSKKVNDIVGSLTGLLVFTPYFQWRKNHAIHHANAGDLDQRGTGDVWTLTVKEYLASPFKKRVAYRIYRNPLGMFILGPLFGLLISQRFVTSSSKKKERYSVYGTNLGILGIILLMSTTIGIKTFMMIQLPIVMVGFMAGFWLFYVQHQFEGVYWERHEKWDYLTEALEGSSFYKLPKVLQWFTGNIGFHHIHHLNPRIPNYNLEKCYQENSIFQSVKPITIRASLKSLKFRLWDEEARQMVGYKVIKAYRDKQVAASFQ